MFLHLILKIFDKVIGLWQYKIIQCEYKENCILHIKGDILFVTV